MSVPLLRELEAAGVHVTREGDTLRVRGEPGVSLVPYRDVIREYKPALLAELQAREEVAGMGLNPALPWVSVSTGPAETPRSPDGWDGRVPPSCGVPNACCLLGPCPHFSGHGRCWKEMMS
jgi:hypothetical protein